MIYTNTYDLSPATVSDEHDAIVEGLEAGDWKTAEPQLRVHIQSLKGEALALLAGRTAGKRWNAPIPEASIAWEGVPPASS